MIHRMVFHNGKLQPIEEVRLSCRAGGLLSGWGLFTTIRVMEGVPFAFERHWQRLHRDSVSGRVVRCHSRKRPCGPPWEKCCSANQVREGCARIYAIYNQTGFWRSERGVSAGRFADLFRELAGAQGSGEAGLAGAWAPRSLASGGSEGDLLAEQRVESLRGAAGRIR